MGPLRRFFDRLSESDEARHAAEIKSWSEKIPEATPIDEATPRQRAKIAGIVRRITVSPMEGSESIKLLVTDGRAECEVVLMGRRSVPGVTLGTRLIVEGVVAEHRGTRRMVNPHLEIAG